MALGGTITLTGSGGTLTSITAGTGLTGGTITSSGTIALDIPVIAVNGGTGQTVYAVGDLLAADTTTTLSRVADVATGNVLLSGGANTLPAYGKVGLTTHVSGILPVANGGTNSSTALNNNRIMVSSGGQIVESAALTNGQLLIGSTGAAPVVAAITPGTGITVTPGAGSITIAAINNGTVTSVGLNVPAEFTTSGSPVTSSGSITINKANQTANTFWAGPTSGGAAAPTFRTIVGNDIPVSLRIQPVPIVITSSTFQPSNTTTYNVANIPWESAVYANYTSVTSFFSAYVTGGSTSNVTITFTLLPATVVGSITVAAAASAARVTSAVFQPAAFSTTAAQSRLRVTVNRGSAGGTDPIIEGINLVLVN